MNSYLAKPKSPLRDVLKALTGKNPPKYLEGIYHSRELGDRVMELQDWCSLSCKPAWGTGIGLLEAAENMVGEAVGNGNIPPGPQSPPFTESVAAVTLVAALEHDIRSIEVRLEARASLFAADMAEFAATVLDRVGGPNPSQFAALIELHAELNAKRQALQYIRDFEDT